ELGRQLPRETACRRAPVRAMEAELGRGPTDPARLEAGALERDHRRVLADLGVLAAENAGDAQRPLGIGDHEGSLGEDAVDPVERVERLAAPSLARDEDAAT